MKYFEILKKNLELKKKTVGDSYKIAVISNIVIFEIKEILEFFLRDNNISPIIDIAEYDNIVQESLKFSNYDAIIIFWEVINFKEGLHSEQFVIKKEKIFQLQNKIKNEIVTVLHNLKKTPLVIFNKFSSALFESNPLRQSKLSWISKNLNDYIETVKRGNTILIDTELIISKLGHFKSKDLRKFYTSKSLYSNEFFISYVQEILAIFLAVKGKNKKVLVVDCDNTLWGGIVGEDDFDKIKICKETFPDKIFYEIQQFLLYLKNQGVLLAICSKNNIKDVEFVFENNPNLILKIDDFVIKKINWNDKASNIIEIAEELNLGLDSFVFVDDSKFEIGLVNDVLPSVKTVLVPENLSNYPSEIYSLDYLFYKNISSEEDLLKTSMYLDEKERKEKRENFNSIDDYLSSLGLKIKLFWNDKSKIERAAQLSQKTNQFNLTTKRYTQNEILEMTKSKNHEVIITSLNDSFGDYGLTGLVILNFKENNVCEVDSLMLSCRILGRNVEFVIFDELVKNLMKRGIKKLNAAYVKSKKNMQVEKLYEKVGFILKNQTEIQKEYELKFQDYSFIKLPYIKIV